MRTLFVNPTATFFWLHTLKVMRAHGEDKVTELMKMFSPRSHVELNYSRCDVSSLSGNKNEFSDIPCNLINFSRKDQVQAIIKRFQLFKDIRTLALSRLLGFP